MACQNCAKKYPFQPILSMVGSSQYALAKYLAAVIDPVLQLYSKQLYKRLIHFH